MDILAQGRAGTGCHSVDVRFELQTESQECVRACLLLRLLRCRSPCLVSVRVCVCVRLSVCTPSPVSVHCEPEKMIPCECHDAEPVFCNTVQEVQAPHTEAQISGWHNNDAGTCAPGPICTSVKCRAVSWSKFAVPDRMQLPTDVDTATNPSAKHTSNRLLTISVHSTAGIRPIPMTASALVPVMKCQGRLGLMNQFVTVKAMIVTNTFTLMFVPNPRPVELKTSGVHALIEPHCSGTNSGGPATATMAAVQSGTRTTRTVSTTTLKTRSRTSYDRRDISLKDWRFRISPLVTSLDKAHK